MEGKCCKCEERHWLGKQKVVWEDPTDGKKYCVFHAPKDQKWKPDGTEKYSLGEFNQEVFWRINSAKDNGQHCSLADVVFPGAISFENFVDAYSFPHVSFDNAIFEGDASFNLAIFEGDASFSNTVFKGFSNFLLSKFTKSAYFFNTQFAKANFSHTTFQTSARFSQITIREYLKIKEIRISSEQGSAKIIFENISTLNLLLIAFERADLPFLSFRNCHWPDRLATEAVGKSDSDNLLRYEELYRAMKQRAAEAHDQPLVSRWHYREKLMAMKRGGNSAFEQAMLWLYFACSGFGERAGQSLLVLLALVGLSLLANAWTPDWSWNEVLPWATAANATLATIPFAKDIPGDGWVKVGRGFWQFLIAIQFTLFALAVRNRFRR